MSVFNQIQGKKPGTNVFDLSHDKKLSLKFGNLYPIFCTETVPGDSFTMSSAAMMRFAPMIAPVMHKVSVYTHFYFVPYRILWDNWEKFITGGRDGKDNSVFPYMPMDEVLESSLADYMGLPTFSSTAFTNVNAMPFAAYQKIFNEYYRDQNMMEEVDDSLMDGSNQTKPTLLDMQVRAWQHDYFTSALPWTQRGPEATIPLGTVAPIIGNMFYPNFNYGTASRVVKTDNSVISGNSLMFDPSIMPIATNTSALTGDGHHMAVDNSKNLGINPNTANWKADLSSATASSINDLRRAFKLQEWLEKNARGGARYTETILSHFGVKSSDARLQRPEFIGGGANPVTISEVLQNSSSNTAAQGEATTTPQGNMAGHGISVGASGSFRYRCEEHGLILGIMSVMPVTGYQQGVPKLFKKFDRFDYYWPSFAHLGEQPVMNYEVYLDPDDTEDDDVFGYLPRYSEYKYIPSTTHGAMRTTLDFWHLNRVFSQRPYLNNGFIKCNASDRIFAVQDESDYLYCHIFNRVKARRPMPYFGTPNF